MISAKSDVQVDTPEVRVTEWRLVPGSATGHHIHEMDYVIVPGSVPKRRWRSANPTSAKPGWSTTCSMKPQRKSCSWKSS